MARRHQEAQQRHRRRGCSNAVRLSPLGLRPTAISLASGPGRAIIDIAIITLNIAKLSVAPLVLLSPLKI